MTSIVSTAMPAAETTDRPSDFLRRVGQFFSSPIAHIAILFIVYTIIFLQVLAFERKVVGHIGFAMDDAWIHAAVARNFVDGLGFGIVPGRPLSVSTSPTWTLLTSFFYLFFSDAVQGTMLLSILCLLGTCACFYLTIRSLTGRGTLGLAGTTVLLLNPIVLWGMASGMELPLALFALSLVLCLYYCYDVTSRVRAFLVPLALAFAAVTRPELFLLIPLAIVDTFFGTRTEKGGVDWPKAILGAVVQSLIVAVALSPYFIFNIVTTGYLFPLTYYAKTSVRGVGLSAALKSGVWENIYNALVREPRGQVYEIVSMLLTQNLVLFLFLLPGAFCFWRSLATKGTSRGWLAVAAIFIIPWVMGMSSPASELSNHAQRYFVIFPPLAILLGCVGINFMIEAGKQRALAVVCLILIMLSPWRTTYKAVQLLAIDVDSTERLYRDMGLWVRDNIDPKAIFATNDIGGLAYFARRDFIDIMGLASPEVWSVLQRPYGAEQDLGKLIEYLRAQKVEYILLSPKYYKDLTTRKEIFEPIKRWSERYPHGRTISPQILYKFH